MVSQMYVLKLSLNIPIFFILDSFSTYDAYANLFTVKVYASLFSEVLEQMPTKTHNFPKRKSPFALNSKLKSVPIEEQH